MEMKERVPVLVGVGRYTQHESTPIDQALTPAGMFRAAALRAALDAGCDAALLADAVAIGCPAMFLEFRWLGTFGKMPFKNFPRTVADELGANPADEFCWLSWHGGNGPQFLINNFADLISKGEMPQGPILIGGVEENATFDRAVRAGKKELLKNMGWDDGNTPPKTEPKLLNKTLEQNPQNAAAARRLSSAVRGWFGDNAAITAYAMFENAYAHQLSRSTDDHMSKVAELLAGFSVIAAAHPEHSWFKGSKTKDFLLTNTDENRMMSYPYSKWMCARDEIDQSACVVMMSWAEAERRGIHRDRLVFLHGSGDAYDTDYVPLRRSYSESPSMRAAYAEAFRSSGLDLGDPDDVAKITALDVYSCFPIAVEQACECLGLNAIGHTKKASSPAVGVDRLTTTGGLPYHGGPGSNYSCHGLCGLVEKLRTPSFRGELGMLCANGGFLTEHACGIYSTDPPTHIGGAAALDESRGGEDTHEGRRLRVYERRPLSEYAPPQEGEGGLLVNGGISSFAAAPADGAGRVITWTVEYSRRPNLPKRGLIVGEMVSGADEGKRFLATTRPNDSATIEWLFSTHSSGSSGPIGREVVVACDAPGTGARVGVWFSAPANKASRL
jgi:acetyl-CoA C-acetyltransferase